MWESASKSAGVVTTVPAISRLIYDANVASKINGFPPNLPCYNWLPPKRGACPAKAVPDRVVAQQTIIPKAVLWLVLGLAALLLIWQLGAESPPVKPVLAASLSAVLALILGIGLGDAARQRFARAIQLQNQRLSEQNDQLIQCNQEILARLQAAQADTLSTEAQGPEILG
jgi:hypothetical protein